jgi:hypothetical protein
MSSPDPNRRSFGRGLGQAFGWVGFQTGFRRWGGIYFGAILSLKDTEQVQPLRLPLPSPFDFLRLTPLQPRFQILSPCKSRVFDEQSLAVEPIRVSFRVIVP